MYSGDEGHSMELMKIDYDLFKRILKEIPSNIFFKDTECRYVFSTHYWRHLKGADDPSWDIAGKTDLEIRKDKDNAKLAMEQDREIMRTGKGTSYVIEINQDGVTEFLELIKNPVRDNDGNIIGIVGLINDVTEKMMLEKQLEKYVHADMLTGLFNRHYLDEWLANCMNADMYPLCVVSADCDGLKKINNSYGHAIGDEFLRLTASLLRVELPEKAVIFRMGGDEFLIILPNTTQDECKKYIDVMNESSQSLLLKGKPICVSFGSCEVTSPSLSFTKAMEIADKRMYMDKNTKYADRND
jgi:diguanylate cyclase (GGDEF)-like protein/PAS domain S-box-containing protein